MSDEQAEAQVPETAVPEPASAGFMPGTRAFLRRLPFLRRPHFAMFPVMAVLIVITVAFGMHLGEDAIAQIDPIHRQGAAPKLRDVTQNPGPPRPNAYASAYSWEQGQLARAEDCGDCPNAYARSSFAPPPPAAYMDATIEPSWDRQSAGRQPDAVPAAAEDSVEWQRVRRYVYYPVSGDPQPDASEFVDTRTEASRRTAPEPRAAPAADPDGL